VLILCDALDAYRVGPFPIPWLAHIGLIFIFLILCMTDKIYTFPGARLFSLLLCWVFLVTMINIFFNDYSNLMPPLATTDYFLYVFLRFLIIITFLATVYIVYWLLTNGCRDILIRWIVRLGTIVSIIAIYIYIAQIHSLPQPPKNRNGTNGGKQPTTFSYAFERVTGTFREPALLAEWLVIPFFLSLVYSRELINLHTIIIGSTVLLTGSLAGILGILLGIIVGLLITNSLRFFNFKLLLEGILILTIMLIIFHYIVNTSTLGSVSLFDVIIKRVAPILLNRGMLSTNRSYIYVYLLHTKIPYFGAGEGNSNLILTQYLGSNVIVSFLSLYFNFMFSSGLIGLTILCCLLVYPLVLVFFYKRLDRNIFWFISGYITWLIIFGVQAEQFTVMFGIIFAFVAFEISNFKVGCRIS
jgi:hypothetical protein